MEEEKVNVFTKILNWVKTKWILLAVIVAVIVVAIVVLSIFVGGNKKIVKKYIAAFNKGSGEKLVECMDFAGQEAWGYAYDVDDFSEEDYDDFMEDYKDVDKDDIEDEKKSTKKYMNSLFEDIKDEYKNYKMKIEEFKSVEKIAKDLYVVKAKISTYAKPKDKDETDEVDETSVVTFVVYKNKIIDTGAL